MSSLQERLDRIKAGFLEQAPVEAVAVMNHATESLRASGIMDRIPKIGDPLPAFSLKDTEDQVVSSADLLAQGPLMLAVYRGLW